MAIKTRTEQLESVQTLIANLESSDWASMTVGERSTTKMQLDALYQREERLRKAVEAETANNGQANGPIRVREIEIDV